MGSIKRGLSLRLVFGVLFATIAGAGVLVYTTGASQQYTVVVATRDIAVGTQLTSADFAALPVTGKAPSDSLLAPKEAATLVEDGVIAVSAIYTGDVLQHSDFFNPYFDPDAPSPGPYNGRYALRLSSILNDPEDCIESIPGECSPRAIVIEGDPTTTFVQPGDLVDIVFVGESSTKVIMTKPVAYAIPQFAPERGSSTPPGTAFILRDMTAQEAQDLVYAQQIGELRVLLARPDADIVVTCETTAARFAEQYGISLPQPETATEGGETGAEPVTIPDVTSEVTSIEEAMILMADAGLVVSIDFDEESPAEPGTVIAQDPAGGIEGVYFTGDTVRLTVAGPEPSPTPVAPTPDPMASPLPGATPVPADPCA